MPAPKLHDMIKVVRVRNGLHVEEPIRRDKAVLELVRQGCTHVASARKCGIHKGTFYRWRKRGEEAKSGIYREFFDELELAEGVAETVLTLMFKRHAQESWQANLKLLERRFADRWKPVSTVEQVISSAGGAAPAVVLQLGSMDPEQLAALAGPDEGEE